LVAAFRATLEEVASADLLIHVRDMSHPDSDAQRDDVDQVLTQLGIGPEDEGTPPKIEAWNKIDLLGRQDREALLTEAQRREDAVPIAALTGFGLDEMRERVADKLKSGGQVHEIRLPAGDGGRIAWLHARGDVIDQRTSGSEIHVQVRLSAENWARFQALQSA
jgi:GTP-binding protein HflX